MVSKKRIRYEMIDYTVIIHKLYANTSGPNASKHNFSLTEKLYPQYTRKIV